MRDLAGQPIVQNEKTVTLGMVVANALLADDKQAIGTEKLERFKLAERVFSGGEHDLTPEEIVLIKKQVEKLFSPLIYARVLEALEGQKK